MRVKAHAFGAEEDWGAVRDTYKQYLNEMGDKYNPHVLHAALWLARIAEMDETSSTEVIIAGYLKVYGMDPRRP